MKITIIGEIFYDEIFPYHGKKQTGFGGILYNLIALANLADSSTILYPISYLWKKHFKEVQRICKPYSNIDLSGIIPSSKGTETARLTYSSWEKREEKIILYNPVILFGKIKKYLDVDAILINFTALREISLATLQKIRYSTKALIMLDLHSFASRIDKNSIRHPRYIPNWEKWMDCVDIVQGNLREMESLLGSSLKDNGKIRRGHHGILKTKTKIVITTLAESGAIISWKNRRKVYSKKISTYPVKKMIDPTGSGDVFASAFLWKYLKTNNPNKSTNYANKIAAINCQLRGLKGLKKLRILTRRTKKVRNTVKQ